MKPSIPATLTIILLSLPLSAAEPAKLADIKRQAQAVCDAGVRGDYAYIVDQYPEGLTNLVGGREKVLTITERAVKRMEADGYHTKFAEAGEPDEPMVEGAHSFVIVPINLEMTKDSDSLVFQSFLLGISSNGGKSWKFIDGAQLDKKSPLRDAALPKFPAGLKLPAKKPPVVRAGQAGPNNEGPSIEGHWVIEEHHFDGKRLTTKGDLELRANVAIFISQVKSRTGPNFAWTRKSRRRKSI